MKATVEEKLETVLSTKVTRREREAFRELAAYYKKSDSQILREIVVQLVRAYEDMKSQMAMGVSAEELAKRTTRLALAQLYSNVSPGELRRTAGRLAEAANQLAEVLEGPPK